MRLAGKASYVSLRYAKVRGWPRGSTPASLLWLNRRKVNCRTTNERNLKTRICSKISDFFCCGWMRTSWVAVKKVDWGKRLIVSKSRSKCIFFKFVLVFRFTLYFCISSVVFLYLCRYWLALMCKSRPLKRPLIGDCCIYETKNQALYLIYTYIS